MVRIPILLSAVMVALPALAHDRDDFRLVLRVISGSVAESIELVLRVLRRSGAHAGDGSSCHLSVAVEALDATGENPTPVTDSAELEPDELFVFDLPLSKLHDAGRIRVAMQITGSGASRACLLEVSGTRRVTITDIKENLSKPPVNRPLWVRPASCRAMLSKSLSTFRSICAATPSTWSVSSTRPWAILA